MTQARNRVFKSHKAVRKQVPLLVGLMGPSGSGKTYSALRLATGMVTVNKGPIFMIDTENHRGEHYAENFDFEHVPFEAPFGSRDYLDALKYCVDEGARCIIVDSMSHEHEGPGGLLDMHEQEVTRMAGNDYAKRERVKMLAWNKPKQARRELINGMLQLGVQANIIFCFRAKKSVRQVRKNNKNVVEDVGFMPIAGDEFVFEQTLNCLLLPGSGGVPTWDSEYPGERSMIKLPEQFKNLAKRDKPLDETVGKHLAQWAMGEAKKPKAKAKPEPEPEEAVDEEPEPEGDEKHGQDDVDDGMFAGDEI